MVTVAIACTAPESVDLSSSANTSGAVSPETGSMAPMMTSMPTPMTEHDTSSDFETSQPNPNHLTDDDVGVESTGATRLVTPRPPDTNELTGERDSPVGDASVDHEALCEAMRPASIDVPSAPFRGLVHATEWRPRVGQTDASDDVESRLFQATFIDAAGGRISELGLCISAPRGHTHCGTFLIPQSDDILYARTGGSSDPLFRIMVLASWGLPLELLTEYQDRLSDPDDYASWPLGGHQKSLPYGEHDFVITDFDNGFALQYGSTRREYALGPWERWIGAQGAAEPPTEPLLTDDEFNDEGFYILGGSFSFAGSDGDHIGIVFDRAEPACAHIRELYIFSLQDGTVQSCLIFSGADAFSLVATPESFEPLSDIKLPPSGWLFTEPCIAFSRYVEGAEFGRDDTDWEAFAERVLQPMSIPQ